LAYVDWRIKGPEISTCNCAWGCPCQFNALPTHGDCRAAMAMRIDAGHFGDLRLDGLHFVTILTWPGAIHEGGGTSLAVIDERASEAQRTALLTILAGRQTEPGATIFSVMVTTLETMHKPRFLPIELEVDIEARTGWFRVPGLIEARALPIRNPVTGKPHRARVVLPDGFEYTAAEYASSAVQAEGPLPLSWPEGHAHLAELHLTPTGPVR
jgi:hypothetical protein